MSAEAIQQRVRTYLVTSYLPGEDGENLRADDDLLLVLNSLQILRMVIELESMFGITIDNSDMAPENLGSIENIAAFVQRKRAS